MAKTFEEGFTEIQKDMISICLEYVENSAEKVYIYASFENNMISCSYFYKINGKVYKRHKINDSAFRNYDVSINRQKACMTILNNDVKKLIALCKEFEQKMPTEIKIKYDAINHKVDASYQYDSRYSNIVGKGPEDMAEEWYEQEKGLEEK